MTLFWLRGLLMDEAGGGDMGGGGGGMEIATIDSGVDTSTETGLTVTNDQGVTTTDDEPETDLEPYQAWQDGKPSRTTAAALATIKATHPQVAKAIPRAMAVESRLRSEFPNQNPFDAIRSMRKTIKDLGGEQGIRDMRQELAEIEELDALYSRSDPRMLDKMTETPEGERAFSKLVPFIPGKLEKLAGGPAAIVSMAPIIAGMHERLAPNSFNKYMATTMLSDMTRNDLDVHFRRLASLVPADNDIAKQSITAIQAYFDRLGGLTKLTPESLAVDTARGEDPQRTELDAERKRLNQEKRGLVIQGWQNSMNVAKGKIIDSAWAALSKGKKISEVDREDILARFQTKLPIALKQIPNFENALKEFFESDDKDGYLRYLQGLHNSHIPRILKAEIQRKFPGAAPAQAQSVTTTTAAKAAISPGFKRVGAQPDMNSVDMRPGRSNAQMWKDKKAILKDGSRVQWA